MFFPSKQHTLLFVEKLQRVSCEYMTVPCDCKFGRDPESSGYQGERTGCPELRVLHAMLTVMNDDEYEEFIRRVNLLTPGLPYDHV